MSGPGRRFEPPTPLPLDSEESPTKTAPVYRKCRNCGKKFAATRADHWFDKAYCRKQWHKNGTAYGQLKEKITKQIFSEVRKQLAELFPPEAIAILNRAVERRREREASHTIVHEFPPATKTN